MTSKHNCVNKQIILMFQIHSSQVHKIAMNAYVFNYKLQKIYTYFPFRG